MTIRGMMTAAALLLAVPVAATWAARANSTGETDERVERMVSRAAETAADMDRLEAEVEGLEETVREGVEAAERRAARAAARLEGLSRRLDRSLASLRASLEKVRADAGASVDRADSALGAAQAVARDLSVLKQRYDLHLRRFHDGG